MSERNIDRILLVGFGSIGKRHFDNLQQLLPEAEIGIVSGHLESAPGNAVLIDSISAAIDWSPSFGVIANGANLHSAVALPLLKNDIPLMIEKPLDISSDAAACLEPYADQPGILLGYCLRFNSVFQSMSDVVGTEKIGTVNHVAARCTSFLPKWRSGTDYRKSVSADPQRGGGALLEISHEVDYVCAMLGQPVSVQCNEVGNRVLDIPVEEHVQIELTFETATASIELSFATEENSRTCVVTGASGEVRADFLSQTVECVVGDEQVSSQQFDEDSNAMYLRELESMVQVVQQHPSPISFTDGMTVLKVIEACKASIASGQRVTIA